MSQEHINLIEQTYRQLVQQGHPIIKLFSGNPSECGIYFPKDILDETYQNYFSRLDYKPHSKGLLIAREAIAHYYTEQRITVDPEKIIITSGTSESFLHLFSLLTQPGDNILTPNPSYPLFDEIARIMHIELRPYHLLENQNWSVDLDHLKSQTNKNTKAIAIVSPHNPTGSVMSVNDISAIVEWANQNKIALICDEVFSEFYFGEGDFPRPMAITKPELCFTLNGISKMLALPSMKLSWIIVSGEKEFVNSSVEKLETINDTFLTCHIPIQEALPVLLDKGKKFLLNYKSIVKNRRDLTIQILSKNPHISFNPPMGSFYLMARINAPRIIDEEKFVIELMKEKGVFVHPGYFYDYEDGLHIVISFLSREEDLKAGLRFLGNQ